MAQKQGVKSSKTPRYRIIIDKKLCEDPISCEIKCVKACPFKLLAYYQRKTPKHGEAPKGFRIISAFNILCNNCERCINVCPNNAIKIKL